MIDLIVARCDDGESEKNGSFLFADRRWDKLNI